MKFKEICFTSLLPSDVYYRHLRLLVYFMYKIVDGSFYKLIAVWQNYNSSLSIHLILICALAKIAHPHKKTMLRLTWIITLEALFLTTVRSPHFHNFPAFLTCWIITIRSIDVVFSVVLSNKCQIIGEQVNKTFSA